MLADLISDGEGVEERFEDFGLLFGGNVKPYYVWILLVCLDEVFSIDERLALLVSLFDLVVVILHGLVEHRKLFLKSAIGLLLLDSINSC